MNKLIRVLTVILGMIFFPGAMASDANNITQEVFTKSLPQQLQLSPQESDALYQKLQQIIQLRNLDQPAINLQDVLNWTTNTVSNLYNFTFKNYEASLKNSRQNFTEKGWGFFQDGLNKSNFLKTVVSKKFIISTGLFRSSVVQYQGSLNGVYTWKIQVPLLVFYNGPTSTTSQKWLVTVQVIRTQVDNNHPNGLIIDSIGIVQQN